VIGSGIATRTDDGTAKALQQSILTVNDIYYCSIDVLSLTGLLQVILDAADRFDITTIGTKTFIKTAAQTSFSNLATNGCSTTIDNVIARKLLEVA